jgi:transcription elongation factor Elf1
MTPNDQGPDRNALGPVTHCAQCGETIYLASWSEHIDARRIKYLWECDACGYSFETLVSLAAPRFDQAA